MARCYQFLGIVRNLGHRHFSDEKVPGNIEKCDCSSRPLLRILPSPWFPWPKLFVLNSNHSWRLYLHYYGLYDFWFKKLPRIQWSVLWKMFVHDKEIQNPPLTCITFGIFFNNRTIYIFWKTEFQMSYSWLSYLSEIETSILRYMFFKFKIHNPS